MTDEEQPAGVTVYDRLRHGAHRWPDRRFISLPDGEQWTWRQCMQEAAAAANALRELGVRRDDRVMIFLPSGAGWIRAWWGCTLLGAVMAPVNTSFRGLLLEDLCARVAPARIVADTALAERITGTHRARVIGPEHLCDGEPTIAELHAPPQPWDTHCLLMTSGTTGPSKASLTTHAYLAQFASWFGDHCGVGPDDRMLADMPLFHLSAFAGIIEMMRLGGQVAVCSQPTMRTYWQTAHELGTTFSIAPGTVAQFLEAQPESPYDRDHSMRFMNCSPLPTDPATFIERFGLDGLTTSYGSTESNCSLAQPLDVPVRPGTCGVPLPGFELRLVDEHDNEVAEGELGELVVRTERPWLLSQGYLDDPAATARSFRNGWFRTGDTLRRDQDGYFYYHDRRKDSLRRRGENISSFEVEREVCAFPDVAEAACVAAPGEFGEDEVKVFLVARAGAQVDPETLLGFLGDRMAHFMIPRFFECIDELPKTPSLRVKKHQLRDRGNTAETWDALAAGYKISQSGISRVQPDAATVATVAVVAASGSRSTS